MKKWGGYILCFLFTLFLLFGCSRDEDDAKEEPKTYIELETKEALEEKIENDDSFVLLVYASWCSHCAKFKPILNEVVAERELTNVYAIEVSKVSGVSSLSTIRYIPTLVVYNKGDASIIASAGGSMPYFSNSDGVKQFFDKYTQPLITNEINLEQLREKKSNNSSFIIYFEDRSLESTQYLNNNYMNGLYNVYSENKSIYKINLSNYNENDKQVIKDEFGLSSGNSNFGYNNGVTPSFQYYSEGVLTDMVVYANDEFSINEGEGSITITDSYYEDNPYINETIVESDYYSVIDDFYNSKIDSFLSQYLQFVD